jgi:hypothetical protein
VVAFGSTVHVYVRAAGSGDLVEFVNDGVGGRVWNVYNQTYAAGGPPLASNPSPVVVGGYVHVYLAAQGSADLVEYVNNGVGGRVWNAYDQSYASGGPPLASDPTPVAVGGYVHVYVRAAGSGDLVEFVNDGVGGRVWNAYDQTYASGGPPIRGDAGGVFFGGTLHIYATAAASGDLVEYVNDGVGGRVWNAYDQTVSSGGPPLAGSPSAIQYGGTVHVYAPGQ